MIIDASPVLPILLWCGSASLYLSGRYLGNFFHHISLAESMASVTRQGCACAISTALLVASGPGYHNKLAFIKTNLYLSVYSQ